MAAPDVGDLPLLGTGAIVMTLVFRTLWKQEGGWRAVLAATREDAKAARSEAKSARDDAATARNDAAAARKDAASARSDAHAARNAEIDCKRQLAAMDVRVTQNTQRLDNLSGGE